MRFVTCSTVFLKLAAEIGRKEKVRGVQSSLEVHFTKFKQSEFNTCEVVLKTSPVTWEALYRKFPENRWVFWTHLEVHCETLSSEEPGYSWIWQARHRHR